VERLERLQAQKRGGTIQVEGDEAMSGARLLVVDDDQAFLDSLRTALQFAGYEVHAAVDGPEALDKAERLAVDGILLDIRMPGIDGYEVCQGLKGNPATAPIPVIFMTGVADPALQQRATDAGAAAWLTKPFRLEALTGLVEAVLANARRVEGPPRAVVLEEPAPPVAERQEDDE
jgi:CheY-like chemotaxis protein